MTSRVELAPGYDVARIINGGWQLARGHGPDGLDPDATVRDLLALAESGLTTFDVGDIYTGVEERLGALVARVRTARGTQPALQIHTKFVPDLEELPRITKPYVTRIIDRSLGRLGVERLDLVQFHWWDYEVPGCVETALWLAELRAAGKIRHLGATNFDVPHLREMIEAGVAIIAHQVQLSLLDRRPRPGMMDYCREHGIHLLAYGTLAGGFLSERYLGREDPAPPLANRSLIKYRLVIEEFGGWELFQTLLRTMARVAARHGVSIANVATRFALEEPQVASIIVGARDARHVASTLRTLQFSLDETDRALLMQVLETARGPAGPVYALERDRHGPHAGIMKYNLNRDV